MRLGTQELSSSGTINSCVKNVPIAKQLKSVFEDHLRKFVFAVGIPLGTYLGAALTQVETDVREVISWDQPIMTQSDGGLLGMLARETPENRRPIPPRGRASGQGQSGRRSLRGTRGGDFFGGGRSKSAGTRKRARRRGTIAMLSPFLPRITSLTRLGVPSNGMRSARVRPC